jgi:16S rRNA (guanine966-N2)-methyltransferase
VREALFSMLGGVQGTEVLDLFAGTGALGIEALSRGAARAVFVEHDTHALAALARNLEELGLEPAEAQIRRGDALWMLRSARKLEETYDLVFVDPPYRRASEWERELSSSLRPLLAPRACVVVESDRRTPLDLPLALERERRYGDTSIRIYRHQ